MARRGACRICCRALCAMCRWRGTRFLAWRMSPLRWTGKRLSRPMALPVRPNSLATAFSLSETRMTSTNAGTSGADTIGGVFAVATRNASSSGELAMASGQIIARRVALGVAAVMNPLRADHAEFERMVPEKLEAFWAVNMIMLRQAGQASRQITDLATDAV